MEWNGLAWPLAVIYVEGGLRALRLLYATNLASNQLVRMSSRFWWHTDHKKRTHQKSKTQQTARIPRSIITGNIP